MEIEILHEFPGGAELSQGDGMEGEHAPRLPGHLPPRGAATQLHRAAGGDGVQLGHPRVEEAAAHCFPRAHAAAAGQCVSVESLYLDYKRNLGPETKIFSGTSK